MAAITTNEREQKWNLYCQTNKWEQNLLKNLSSIFPLFREGEDLILLNFSDSLSSMIINSGMFVRKKQLSIDNLDNRYKESLTSYIDHKTLYNLDIDQKLSLIESSWLPSFIEGFFERDYIQNFNNILHSLNAFICRVFNMPKIKKIFIDRKTMQDDLKSITTRLEKLESNLSNDYNAFCKVISKDVYGSVYKCAFTILAHQKMIIDAQYKEYNNFFLKSINEIESYLDSIQNACIVLSFLFYEYKLYLSKLKEIHSILLENPTINTQFTKHMKRNYTSNLDSSLTKLTAVYPDLKKILINVAE